MDVDSPHRTSIAIDVAGTSLHLLGARALYWPEAKTLCIADAHFGKAASFRAFGQPVPEGTTASNLARIDRLLDAHDVSRLVFLGDLFHDRRSLAALVVEPMIEWRKHHPSLECVLVLGNHDRRAGALPPALGIETVGEPYLSGPFALCHEAREHPTHHALAGHVHPVYMLKGAARQAMRLPCFVTTAGGTLMPAFGEFTGGYEITPDAGDRVFVTTGAQIWAVR